MTEQRLRAGAMFHMDRYAVSSRQLRKVLLRRVDRGLRELEDDERRSARPGWVAFVDALIADLQKAGLVDDVALAQSRMGVLQRRGRSMAAIRASLRAKGIPGDIVDDVTANADPHVERLAAIRYARRRGLGPFRAANQRAERRRRDLAAMARSGFGYGLASGIIDGEADALVAELPPDTW